MPVVRKADVEEYTDLVEYLQHESRAVKALRVRHLILDHFAGLCGPAEIWVVHADDNAKKLQPSAVLFKVLLDEVDQVTEYSCYYEHVDDVRALLVGGAVKWTERALFTALSADFKAVIYELADRNELKCEPHPCYCWRYEKAAFESPEVKDCIVRPLDNSDVDAVDSAWAYRTDFSREHIRKLVKSDTSAGVYVSDHPTAVAWAVRQAGGEIGMVHTLPSHRRHGFARTAVASLTARLKKQKKEAFAFCLVTNTASNSLFEGLGFRNAADVVWIYTEPLASGFVARKAEDWELEAVKAVLRQPRNVPASLRLHYNIQSLQSNLIPKGEVWIVVPKSNPKDVSALSVVGLHFFAHPVSGIQEQLVYAALHDHIDLYWDSPAVEWNKLMRVASIDERLVEGVRGRCEAQNLKFRTNPCHLWTCQPEDFRPADEKELPEGAFLGPLRLEDCKRANDLWPYHTEESFLHMQQLVRECETMGAFVKGDPLAVCWAFRQLGSEIGMVQTADGYQRKGFARQVCSAMTASILRKGDVPFCYIVCTNVNSQGLFRSLGFKQLSVATWCVVGHDTWVPPKQT